MIAMAILSARMMAFCADEELKNQTTENERETQVMCDNRCPCCIENVTDGKTRRACESVTCL